MGLERTDLVAQLAAIGVADVRLEISGGRSTVERLGNQENAVEVTQRLRSTGFGGCWVIIVGANDAANIAAGANTDAAARVQRVIDAIGGQPTLWLTATSVATTGYWERPSILAWNDALGAQAAAHPDTVVVDWDAVANTQPWYVADGIHPNAAGSAEMARFVAASLLFVLPLS